MSHLRPCSGCSRHVRANATACPFCAAALAIEPAPPAGPHERLGRAARMAFGGAAIAISVAGCEKSAKENIAMPYGAPPDPSAKVNIAMPYGAPPDPSLRQDATDAGARPDAASAALDATAPVATADAAADAGKAKPPPTAVVKQPPPNIAKPYGAPPADGYDVFEV
jgi:hypothetical protein